MVGDEGGSTAAPVTTPKQVEVWDDTRRSKVGKVLKSEIKAQRDA